MKLSKVMSLIIIMILFVSSGCTSIEKTSKQKQTIVFSITENNARVSDRDISVSSPQSDLSKKLGQDFYNELKSQGLIELPNGCRLDLDEDGVDEVINLVKANQEYLEYLIQVGNREIPYLGESPEERIYAAYLNGKILLVVGGDSPLPYSNIYCYDKGHLYMSGEVGGRPSDISIQSDNIFGRQRGKSLQTWWHEARYLLSNPAYSDWNEDMGEFTWPVITKIPQGLYPMGTIVKFKKDCYLQMSRFNDSEIIEIKQGVNACISGSDDQDWIYITFPYCDSLPKYFDGGWLKVKSIDKMTLCLPDGEEINADDLFSGLSHAG